MRSFLKHLIMTSLLSASLAAAAGQLTPLRTVEGISEYQLDNGLRVVLFPDRSKPTATVNVTYLVGSRHEDRGETGMAHLLEHLMFKGSAAYPDPTKEFTRRGFQFNGTTWLDRTNYFVTFAADDDNLRWALGWMADAMVNSRIAQEDLDSEMTVVRNEYEAGENKPTSVLLKRMQAILYDWHGYGRSTIGARSDIERVPIENIRAFYQRWYQPDNAVLTLTGSFDRERALELIQRLFGAIPRPTRALPGEWTVEPVADGPRYLEVRRPGETQLVMVGYRVPSGMAADSMSLETAVDLLSSAPRGRLYKALVEGGLAGQVFGWHMTTRWPGFVIFGAVVKKGDDLGKVRDRLIEVVEDAFTTQPVAGDELSVSLAETTTEFERLLSDPQDFAIELTDYISLGDWRLFFVDRDSVSKVTAASVARAAGEYFRRDNRVVGVFIPDDEPRRAPALDLPSVDEALSRTTFRERGDEGEAFDASNQNIDARTERLTINGARVALLPKRNRGRVVNVAMRFHYGNLASRQGRAALDETLVPMLSRGAGDLDRVAISDAMTRLKMQGDLFSFTTDADHLVPLLDLIGRLTRESDFPPDEFERLIRQQTTTLASRSDDPVTLARDALTGHFNTYPKDDPRYRRSVAERLAQLPGLRRDDLAAWFRDAFATDHGEVAIIGDFDPAPVKEALSRLLGGKRPTDPSTVWTRFTSEYRPVTAARLVIDTPSKENAALMARADFAANAFDPDAPAIRVANWILGGGTGLSNRLVDRLRQRDGLSYGVSSAVRLPSFGDRASWIFYAIVAPQNLARAEAAAKEEIARALADGVSEEELAEAKRGMLQSLAIGRAQDGALAETWLTKLAADRTFADSAEFERAVEALTVADVNQALRRVIAPESLTWVLAGDEKRAAEMGQPLR